MSTNNGVSDEDDYESLVATIELLCNPEARQRLREIEEQRERSTLEFVSSEKAVRRLLA